MALESSTHRCSPRHTTISQALSDENGQWFDVMAVEDRETGKEFSLYFNITWQRIHGHKDKGGGAR
jgi:hypothetical protein